MSNGIPLRVVVGVALAAICVLGCDSRSGGAASTSRPAPDAALHRVAGDGRYYRAEHDRTRARVWALGRDGVDLYDARSGTIIRSIPLPDWLSAGELYACAPGLVVLPSGNVVITSNVLPAVWAIDPAGLHVTKHDLAVDDAERREIGFSSLEYDARLDVLRTVHAFDGSVWSIDGRLTRARRIGTSAAPFASTLACHINAGVPRP